MKIVIDFNEALEEYAIAIRVDTKDNDSMHYVADLFELIVYAGLDSNKEYKHTVEGVVEKISAETGESRAVCQSACDLATTMILSKIESVFVGVKHIDLFKTRKRFMRHGLATYVLDIPDPLPVHI